MEQEVLVEQVGWEQQVQADLVDLQVHQDQVVLQVEQEELEELEVRVEREEQAG